MLQTLSENLAGYLADGSALAIPTAFIGGVLVSFTPCVYPIIPIQLGFIGAQTSLNREKSVEGFAVNGRGFILSVLFVVGMSFVYAALGAFAGLTGTLFGSWAASPWTYILVANVIIIFALSMFDVFTLEMPQFLNNWNPQTRGRGHLSALVIGASSGLVVGPCTAPALGATLAYVGTQGNAVFGSFVLFAFAFGMGTLPIIIGTFGSSLALLPRAGNWMNKIKTVFGVLLLAVAQYLLVTAGQRF